MTQLRRCAFPVPPLNEQRRIVSRVQGLLRHCADLRERLRQATESQARIADALLAEIG
ncbi:MAG: hypothetical protein M3Y55_11625 [Pseudomonadota bacterium]|nr:hypothetical protein [Pseudomonadota bacterium]